MNQSEKESPKIPGEEEYERAVSLVSSGNRKESITLFRKSASLNYPPSFLWLHILFKQDKNEKQNWMLKAEPKFNWYLSKAQDGKPDSLFNLGYCFRFGIGTEINLEKAVELYTKAAEQGLASAQCSLGNCYHNGVYSQNGGGVPEDMDRAIELYTKAADQGFAEAQYNLGDLYKQGETVPRDMNRAIELYSKAAAQGLSIAQELNFSHENIDMQVIGDALKLYNGIERLFIENCEITDERVQVIADILKVNSSLTYLYLVENEFKDKGAKTIGDALKFNNTLKRLSLFDTLISNLGAPAFAEALRVNSTLTELYLNYNGIDGEGAQVISEALKVNNTLSEFGLNANLIRDSGAQAIADALKVNASIKLLDLDSNGIGDIGAQAIGEALKVNTSLTSLILGRNNIKGEGAQAIGEALKLNNTLTYLDLYDCKIGNSGVQAIADALKIDRTPLKENELKNANIANIEQALKMKKVLLDLNLSDTEIGDKGVNAIAEMLRVNNSLRKLNIAGDDLTDISKLGDALKYNRSLTVLAVDENESTTKELEKVLQFNICLLHIERYSEAPYQSPTINELLERNKELQTNLSKRIFECKNAHFSLLDYKILERVNVAVIFKKVWKLHQTQQTGKTYEEYLREYWELTIGFPKYFLFILGVCKLNQIPPFRSHLLGIPKEILNHIGSFLNPKDFSIEPSESHKVLKTENEEMNEIVTELESQEDDQRRRKRRKK